MGDLPAILCLSCSSGDNAQPVARAEYMVPLIGSPEVSWEVRVGAMEVAGTGTPRL